MFESKAGVLFIAGLAFFALAFLSNVVVPVLMFRDLGEATAEEVVNDRVLYQFTELSKRYPESFRAAFDAADVENCAEALRLGRQIYVGEGCWHCHSQFVRPVSNESRRYGEVSQTWEYQNELQRPVMFGTRRVGTGSESRRRTARQRLARRALLPPQDDRSRIADAGVSLVVRRRSQQAQQTRPGPDHLRPVARLLARQLSVLRRTRIDQVRRLLDSVSSHGRARTMEPS